MTDLSRTLSELGDAGRREYWAALALRYAKGIGRESIASLLRRFGSAWDAVDHVLDWPKEFHRQGLQSNEWRKKAKKEWEDTGKIGSSIVLWTDPLYPSSLKLITDSPAFLYGFGDIGLLSNPCVAVIGSRKCSATAAEFTTRTATALSKAGVTVVSGMAYGIDAFAHKGSLPYPGSTVAVLAGGVDRPYPRSSVPLYHLIRESGLVISEIPPGTAPINYLFPVRNRIISGMSSAVIVTEAAGSRSGSLLTAHIALEQGKNVFVPSPALNPCGASEGTKELLLDGAKPLFHSDDILAHLYPDLKRRKNRSDAPTPPMLPAEDVLPTKAAPPLAKERPSLSPEESQILNALEGKALSPDDLLRLLQQKDPKWTTSVVSSMLTMMEMRRLVRRNSRALYEVQA